MSSQDIEDAIEQLVAAGKAYVVATVVRTVAPSSAKAGDKAVLDEDGILAGWVGGGCAKPAVTRNAAEALRDGQTRLVRISHDIEELESGIMGYPMTCQSGGTLDIYIEPVMPKPLLVVIGQTAIAQALCALAAVRASEIHRAREPMSTVPNSSFSGKRPSYLSRPPAQIETSSRHSERGAAFGSRGCLDRKNSVLGGVCKVARKAHLRRRSSPGAWSGYRILYLLAPFSSGSSSSHTPQERDRWARIRVARAAFLDRASSSGTWPPVPKYISSGVCPLNAEWGSLELCSAT